MANNSKPVDLWLWLFGIALGIILYLLPKTPFTVVICLVAIFVLLFHPIWNFWWIEKATWRRFSALGVLAIALFIFGLDVWPEPSVHETEQSATLQDRHLSLEQANYFVASLNGFNGQSVVLNYVLGDTESQIYAQEIAQVLANAHWNIKRVVGLPLTFRGIRITPQDPTDVPQAAEALLRAFNDQSISLARDYIQPTSFEYSGNKYVPTLYLFIGKNGTPTPIPPKYATALVVPTTPKLPVDLKSVGNKELVDYAAQTAAALRNYETQNRRSFEAEWHIHGSPLEKDSYRWFFEKVLRPSTTVLRNEIQRRLGIGPATVWALDGDALDGIQPLRDAANYLDELAKKLS